MGLFWFWSLETVLKINNFMTFSRISNASIREEWACLVRVSFVLMVKNEHVGALRLRLHPVARVVIVTLHVVPLRR